MERNGREKRKEEEIDGRGRKEDQKRRGEYSIR